MFRYEIDAPPFGRLWKQGQHTKVWSGQIALPPFEGEFDIVLRGTPDGPLPAQTASR